ncbi:MAG: glycosyltransferase [Candidatus Cloacimonetes bacterium]|nr:glycosyltransferase [Candidatus Cloacimonadota bacterium]
MSIIIYLFCVLLIVLTLGNLRNFRIKNPQENCFSILIACRNEEKNLQKLFDSLKEIEYPSEKFEIIIVDDASTDRSFEMIDKFSKELPNITALRVLMKDEIYKGKKAALKMATEHAKHDFFLFSDADCIVPPKWLQNLNKFISPKIGAVIGYYIVISQNSFTRFLKFINAGSFSATTGLGFPVSAAGSNLLIRKKTFQEVKGYESIKHEQSGDDKLMINLIKKTNWKIAYNNLEPVKTWQVSDIKTRSAQYKRQYGKFQMFPISYKIVSVFVFIFYMYFPISVLVDKRFINFYLYFGFALLYWISILLKHKQKFHLFDLFYVLYYPYFLTYYAITGMFFGWKWK